MVVTFGRMTSCNLLQASKAYVPTDKTSGKLTIPLDAEPGEVFIISCDVAKNAVTNEDQYNNIIYSPDKGAVSALADLGLELVPYEERNEEYRNYGVIMVGEDGIKQATKGTKIGLLLDNLGALIHSSFT